jgi:hypothetical protein
VKLSRRGARPAVPGWPLMISISVAGMLALSPAPTPQPPLPNYCSQTATGSPTYRPCPGDVTGPLRGGDNHRWPDGSDE